MADYYPDAETNVKIRDLEEKQRILQDRVFLLGKNIVETKESHEKKLLEMKKELEELKQKVERIVSFIETLSGEFSKFARKEDVEILAKQMKIFQPLAKVRKT